MKHFLILLTLLFSTSLLAEEKQTPQSTQALAEQLEALAKESELPGFQLALIDKNGITWHHEFGYRDLAEKLPMEKDTLQRAGSTTKSFVAIAILQLVEAGKLSLDDNITALAPEINIDNPWSESHPIKLIHLLEHTSGLADMHHGNLYNLDNQKLSLLEAINRDSGSLIVRWQPGTRHSYSNPGYGILGYLLEKVTGQNYSDYVKQQVLVPLGMEKAFLDNSAQMLKQTSHGYKESEAVPFMEIFLTPAGSLTTSASDLAKLPLFLLSRGESASLENLNANTISQMETPQSTLAGEQGLLFGYGLGVYGTISDKVLWHGHGGAIDGFLTSYAYSSDLGKGYAMIINSSTVNARKMFRLVRAYLEKDFEPTSVAAQAGVDPSMEGYYKLANHRTQLTEGLVATLGYFKVTAGESEMTISQLIGPEITLLHQGNNQFRLENNPVADSIYVKNSSIGPAIELDGQFFVKVSAYEAIGNTVLSIIAIIGLLITLIYLPVWLINMLRGKTPDIQRKLMRIYPAIGLLSLLMLPVAAFQLTLFSAAQLNLLTLSIFALTLLIPIFTLLSGWQLVNVWSIEQNKAAKVMSLISLISLVLVCLLMLNGDYVGLRLWAMS